MTNAVLGGTATITGLTTFNGGTHAPGNSPGIQTFASGLTYAAPTTVSWELWGNTTTNTSGTVFDQIILSNSSTVSFNATTTVTLDFGSLGVGSVDWSSAFWSTAKTGTNGWRLYQVAGPSNVVNFNSLVLSSTSGTWKDSTGASFDTVRSGYSFNLYQDPGTGDIYIGYAVPEPASLALLGVCGALASIAYRRRRR